MNIDGMVVTVISSFFYSIFTLLFGYLFKYSCTVVNETSYTYTVVVYSVCPSLGLFRFSPVHNEYFWPIDCWLFHNKVCYQLQMIFELRNSRIQHETCFSAFYVDFALSIQLHISMRSLKILVTLNWAVIL